MADPRPRPRVMVVDPDVSRIRLMHAALSADFQVVQATTGDRALHLARLAVPDLMLIDIALPDMDGLALVEALRADPATQALGVVLLCDPGPPPDGDRTRALALREVLARPVDPARLHRTVSALTRPATPEVAPPDATIARLATLPGLDTAAGLRHVAGSVALYLSVLQSLIARHAEIGRQIAEALDRGDHDAALRLAHTAKTLCRTIGADALGEMAFGIEHHLKSGASGTPCAEAFIAAYDRLTDGIRRALPGPAIMPATAQQP